jgi:type II secretory ATPase GspE/PulE/Tfp pilus assembly ATPase PilB-like protein
LVSDALRELVHSRANAQRIRAQAVSEGMTLLYDDGIRKMRDGVTTIEEVVRVTTWE